VVAPAFAELAHAVGNSHDDHASAGRVGQPDVQGDADDLADLVQGQQERRVQFPGRAAGPGQGGLALGVVDEAPEQRGDDRALPAGGHQVQRPPVLGKPVRVERGRMVTGDHGGHGGDRDPGQGLGHGQADGVRGAALAGHLRVHRPLVGLPRVPWTGKGLPAGSIEVSPCRSCPGEEMTPSVIPISEGGPGCGGSAPVISRRFTDHDSSGPSTASPAAQTRAQARAPTHGKPASSCEKGVDTGIALLVVADLGVPVPGVGC
jgi:hypothetical protein